MMTTLRKVFRLEAPRLPRVVREANEAVNQAVDATAAAKTAVEDYWLARYGENATREYDMAEQQRGHIAGKNER